MQVKLFIIYKSIKREHKPFVRLRGVSRRGKEPRGEEVSKRCKGRFEEVLNGLGEN